MTQDSKIFPLLGEVLIRIENLNDFVRITKSLNEIGFVWNTGDKMDDDKIADSIWKLNKGKVLFSPQDGAVYSNEQRGFYEINSSEFIKLFLRRRKKRVYIQQSLDSAEHTVTFRVHENKIFKRFVRLEGKIAEFKTLSEAISFKQYVSYFKQRESLCL